MGDSPLVSAQMCGSAWPSEKIETFVWLMNLTDNLSGRVNSALGDCLFSTPHKLQVESFKVRSH